MDSYVGRHVRVPTRRETVVLAWEAGLVLCVIILLRTGVSSTLRWVHNRLNATRGLESNIPYEQSVFECMQRPLEFLSLFTVGTALAEAVSRPLAATGLLRHILTLRELGIIFSATWFLLRWIDRIRSRFAVDKRIDKSQVDATSRIATVATFIVSLLISLDTIGINVQTVLAFGGIGGVAIGFAGREIISNFFGGFMIYVTRPFSVGEWVRSIEERELNGTVEDIGWYLTRVRTWDKRPLYIPNSRFSTLIVENGSRMDNRRILHTLRLRHEDIPVVSEIVAELESLLMTHQELDPRQHRLAYVDSFDDLAVNIWLSCYTKSVFLYDYRRVQQDILMRCHGIIRAKGAKLATRNTRDVRPGSDTDRYGPFGNLATFGQKISTAESGTKVPDFAPVNSDVPGAPRYVRTDSAITMNTIESGLDPSRLAQPSVPNGVPTAPNGVASVGESMTKGESLSAPDTKEAVRRDLSDAAVAATAAAFLAARRNAMRIEDNEKAVRNENGSGKVDGVEPGSSDAGAKNAANAPAAQMKISAAPPIRPPTSATSVGNVGTGSSGKSGSVGGDGKGAEDSQAGGKVVQASGDESGAKSGTSQVLSSNSGGKKGTKGDESGSMTGGVKPTISNVGAMKINKGDEGGSKGGGAGSAVASSGITTGTKGDDSSGKVSISTPVTGNAGVNVSKGDEGKAKAGGAASSQGPGVMKISKARKQMPIVPSNGESRSAKAQTSASSGASGSTSGSGSGNDFASADDRAGFGLGNMRPQLQESSEDGGNVMKEGSGTAGSVGAGMMKISRAPTPKPVNEADGKGSRKGITDAGSGTTNSAKVSSSIINNDDSDATEG